jgi:hypothetical protein
MVLGLTRKDQYLRTTKLQNFFRDKLPIWADNGSCVEDILNNFKDIVFEGIERFVPHKILK